MCGATKDRASAVVHQDEVRDINRQFPRGVKGVADFQPGVIAALFGLFQRLFGRAAFAHVGAECCDRGVVTFQRFRQRMIGRDADKRRAHQGVGAGRVNLYPVVSIGGVGQAKAKLQTTGFADPVGLHQLDLRRPVIQPIKAFKQFFGIIRDFKEPLRQLAALNLCARTPALAVFDLLVRQNGHIDRIPVHDRLFAINQALFQKIEEQRLLLTVVFRITGGQFARPINRQAQRLHLIAHVGDVLIGPILGVAAAGHRRVFGGHAECIPTHRVQHIMPGGHLITRDHVAHRIVAHVPDVDAPRRVREHFQHVILWLVVAAHRLEHIGGGPCGLPAGFDFSGGIGGHLVKAFFGQAGSITAMAANGAGDAARNSRSTVAQWAKCPVHSQNRAPPHRRLFRQKM